MTFRAVAFDMDGVLTDSEPAFFAAVNDILARYNKSVSLHDYERFIGSATPAMWTGMIAEKQLPATLDEILTAYEVPLMRRLREPRPALPGAIDLLTALRERRIPIALCTASYRRWVDAILPAAGITITFDAYATADMVAATKPAPDPYLLAAQQLGVEPARCIAIEDSLNGLTSAITAGMHVIQLRATPTSAQPHPAAASIITSSQSSPSISSPPRRTAAPGRRTLRPASSFEPPAFRSRSRYLSQKPGGVTSMALTQETAARKRLALPVLRTHTVGLLLVPIAAIAVALTQPTDFDYWWHRRTGEYIVNNLSVPRADMFSFTANGQAWTDHEWLSQVLIYLGGAAFGYLALFMLFMALGVGAWWLTYRLLQREGLGELQSLGLSIAVAAFGATYWRVRPAMFTVFLLAFFLSELFAARRGERQRLWHLAPIMALWANLHGGYVIGLVLLALFAMSQWWDRRTTTGPKWQHVALVLAVVFLAAGLNPYTYKLWEYPLTYLGGGGNASLAQIDEWQSPNFHQLRNLPLALLLVSGLIVGANGRRFDVWRTLLMLVFGVMALQAMRHQPLFAIVWAAVIGPSLLERWPGWGRTANRRGGVSSINYGLFAAAIAALTTVFIASPDGIPLWSAPTGGAVPQPVAGAAYIDQHYPGARIFNQYEWGGYLIDSLYPRESVFIDGRADLYGPLVVEYDSLIRGRNWQPAFDRYAVDVVLLSPQLPIVSELKQAGWAVAYEDTTQIVLAKP